MVEVRHFPQLRLLCWNRPDDAVLDGVTALALGVYPADTSATRYALAGGGHQPDRTQPLAERQPRSVHRGAGGERELPTSPATGEEARPRVVPRETFAGDLGCAARGATESVREPQALEERAAGSFIRRDLLDLGEGDVVGGAFDGAMRHGQAMLAYRSDQEAETQDLEADVSAG